MLMGKSSSRRPGFWPWFDRFGPFILVGLVAFAAVGLTYLALGNAKPNVVNAQSGPIPTFGSQEATSCVDPDPALAAASTTLATDSANFRLAVLGDSTRDETAAAPALFSSLRAQLEGVPAENVANFGKNGRSLERYAPDAALQQSIVAFSPTMIELSIGINDLRQGLMTGDEFEVELTAYVEQLHEKMPNASILLSVPAALSTQNVNDVNYITAADGTVNPTGMAQQVTDELRAAYLSVSDQLDYVALNDTQDAITGTTADAADTPNFLADQIHPNQATNEKIASRIVSFVAGTCS